MKIRLFCFLSALFVVAGLLLPGGVYAADAPTSAPIVTTDSTTTEESCNSSTQSTAIEAVGVEAEATSVDGTDPGATTQCEDENDGSYSSVSWNS